MARAQAAGLTTDPEIPETGSGLFTPVASGRVSELIIDQIRLLIRQGQLRPGDRLPAERDLCERFGVSRVTVREALRVLESSGLVHVRVGARGGAFVTAPTSGRLGEGIADLISLSAMSAADVTEARQVLEIGIVPFVCDRATDQDLDELTDICQRAKQALARSEYSMTLSAEFHIRVARATHNPALVMLVESFRGPLLMSLEEAQERAPKMGRRGVREHEEFVAAVRARDVQHATAVMEKHLGRTARRVRG
jgi:DNA-binding FadR family transcriptional regulator